MEHAGEYRGDKPEELYTELIEAEPDYSFSLRIETLPLVAGKPRLVSIPHLPLLCNPKSSLAQVQPVPAQK